MLFPSYWQNPIYFQSIPHSEQPPPQNKDCHHRSLSLHKPEQHGAGSSKVEWYGSRTNKSWLFLQSTLSMKKKNLIWKSPTHSSSDPFGQSWGRRWGPSMNSEHSWFSPGNKKESAGRSPSLSILEWFTHCGTLTADSNEMASARGTGIDVILSRSLNSFRKHNVPPESFPSTWYLLGMSPGWMHAHTRFTYRLMAPSQKVLTELFSSVDPMRWNKDTAHFLHSHSLSLVWTFWY